MAKTSCVVLLIALMLVGLLKCYTANQFNIDRYVPDLPKASELDEPFHRNIREVIIEFHRSNGKQVPRIGFNLLDRQKNDDRTKLINLIPRLDESTALDKESALDFIKIVKSVWVLRSYHKADSVYAAANLFLTKADNQLFKLSAVTNSEVHNAFGQFDHLFGSVLKLRKRSEENKLLVALSDLNLAKTELNVHELLRLANDGKTVNGDSVADTLKPFVEFMNDKCMKMEEFKYIMDAKNLRAAINRQTKLNKSADSRMNEYYRLCFAWRDEKKHILENLERQLPNE